MLHENILFLIYWEDLGLNGYPHGTRLIRRGHLVSFENRLLPPGKTIHEWRSVVNYQQMRTEVQLPVLIAGGEYGLRAVGRYEPEESVLLRIRYFDREDSILGTDYLESGEELFLYPADAFSYSVSLVQAGSTRLVFSHLALFPWHLCGMLEATEIRSQIKDALQQHNRMVILPESTAEGVTTKR